MHFHKQFSLNVLGLLLSVKESLPLFLENGGSIINISLSVTTLMPANSSVYTVTKGEVDALTGVLAKELAPRKIRVNVINSGLIATEGAHAGGFIEGDIKAWVESIAPLGRSGQADDIAPSAVYLAFEDSKYLTSETINISGRMK